MFNKFKQFLSKPQIKKEEENEVMVAERTIKKIHSEFDSAAERLLKEANEIINGKNASKGERLLKVGFGSAAPVKEYIASKQSKELCEKILYYESFYPNNKFITKQEVQKICGKYGLLFGPSSKYIGDIPEINLVDIENFKLRKQDEIPIQYFRDYNDINPFVVDSIRPSEETYSPPLEICAPEKDFDMRYMQKIDGYKLKYDPIVLQPVNGGYLIVTKWGLEAKDEIVINNKMN